MGRPITRIQSPLKPLRVATDGSIWLRSSQVSLAAAATRGRDDEAGRAGGDYSGSSRSRGMAAKAISSPVPVEWYPTLAVLMVSVGLMFTASFFIYEATSSRRSRSLAKEIATAAVASVFLGFGSLFVLLASGVYV
ncbi:hypothetical protein BDA96_10G225800 [Sorghum bicolor]|uniref:Dolichyl-diphosphooligosaccharide-protein glycosyltransferase subunit OST5 n=2 Tax=Sorghum bicolor TaxID=4558 RepID=A0A921Q670_SORBI|nr:transmembrane protein 258 [Sorghum bicolor]KAG0514815.1 hypothetical protein BDA96_10G225800 [Sorghum bicolor]OQU76596.1 hypothetical protein SORBI_3010G171501 [Sorghum bicolor]|eukprot:XP_002437178.2 transmembrane protein 258 [Sorghum bicolor]